MLRAAVILAVVACSSSPPKQVAPPPPPPQPQPIDAAVYRPPPMPDAATAPARRPPPDAAPPPSCPVVNPKGCPASEPNVNHPCAPKNIECVYDSNCCHAITYVCAKSLHFEAHIQSCR